MTIEIIRKYCFGLVKLRNHFTSNSYLIFTIKAKLGMNKSTTIKNSQTWVIRNGKHQPWRYCV